MPIKGLTKDVEIGLGLPLIARIKKGEEKQVKTRADGSTYETVGKDLDYFRIEFEPQYEHLRDDFESIYGDQPTELWNVLMGAPTVDEAFPTWLEQWTATALLHQCDSEQQNRWYNTEAQRMMTAKKACDKDADKPCACTRIGRLNIVLPDFTDETGALGYFMVTTHSIHDIITVFQYLTRIYTTCGSLGGIPFTFGRAAKEVRAPKQVKKNGKMVNEGRIKTTKSLFYLHADEMYVKDTLLPLLKLAPTVPALPAPRPAIDVDKAKAQLDSGIGARLGMPKIIEETGEIITEAEIIPDSAPQTDEKAVSSDLPAETVLPQGEPEKPAPVPYKPDVTDLVFGARNAGITAKSEIRFKVVNQMINEGALKGCENHDEALALVVKRLQKSEPKPEEKTEQMEQPALFDVPGTSAAAINFNHD